MNLLKHSIFLFLITFSLNTFAKIIETADTEVIRQETSDLSSKDLVVFDVMNVLFSPADKITQRVHKKDYDAIINSLKTELGSEKADIFRSIILMHTRQALVDEGMPALIKSLQENNVKVVALTSSKTGSFGKIPSLENLRLKTLKNLGIDFSDSFPEVVLTLSDKPFSELNQADEFKGEAPQRIKIREHRRDLNNSSASFNSENGIPIFKDGVIFTSRMEKGPVLKSFLSKVNFAPKKIVFIDNKLRKIKSVEAYCKENGIKFVGIHYTKFHLASYSNYDKEIVAKQFEVLKARNIWPNDVQAKCLLDNPGKYRMCFKG